MLYCAQTRAWIDGASAGLPFVATSLAAFTKVTLTATAMVAAIVASAAASLWVRVFRSRPLLNGLLKVRGLEGRVRIGRDAMGLPIISGGSRADVAFGLGFLHAQERFFQMDMSRRAAAGELAEVLGKTFVPSDRRARRHQFRKRVERIYAALSADELAVLGAYTAGVTAGLEGLRASPFEYLFLRSRPAQWLPQDTLLVVFHMYLVLQDERADQDFNRYLLYAALPKSIAEFLAPEDCAKWAAPLVGSPSPVMEIPKPEILDFRRISISRIPDLQLRSMRIPGSNAWAVAGKHTRSGKAIVANDMHLPFSMPPLFYRATLEVAGRESASRLSGITLPGFPFLLAGTNGEVSWGLANAAIDCVDLVRLDQSGLPTSAYRTSDGVRELEIEREIIRVRGEADREVTVTKTLWGPVARKSRDGITFAQSWLAYEAGAVNLAWHSLETATTVAEALDAANRIGAPTMAFVAGDRHGDVGWTLAGPLPRGSEDLRRLPQLSSEKMEMHHDNLRSSHYPRLQSPDFSRIWAANARMVTEGEFGEMLAGGYHSCGARASQIRDALKDIDVADEESMLLMQRDDRALFLRRWNALFLEVLQSEKIGDHPRLTEVRAALLLWSGRAAAESVAYRLLRQFRDNVERLVFEPFISLVRASQGQFDLPSVSDQLEEPLWRLVTECPVHLLPPWFVNWEALMMAAALETLSAVPEDSPLRSFVWGAINTLSMRHPLSQFIPFVGRFLDARPIPLDGDLNVPLAQRSGHGPVFRFVISPGDEGKAIMQMAGGQTANPLAPYYLGGHDEWLVGRPAPLCPGPPAYTLVLDPLVAG